MGQISGLSFLALLVALSALIVSGLAYKRQAAVLIRYRALLQNNAGINVEEYLLGQNDQLEALAARLSTTEARVATLESAALHHLQRVAVVRYNAFSDTGSDLSFSIAILDGENNGLVLSSLYGRTESRTYAKPIQAGRSRYALSGEEQAALDQAMAERRGSTCQ